MDYYVSLDSGGSKSMAILFDENMKLLGQGLTEGSNTTQTSVEDATRNLRDCVHQIFEGNEQVKKIKCVFFTSCGTGTMMKDALESCAKIEAYQNIGEAKAGLYAGGLMQEGILALSGTGSDVFWVDSSIPKSNTVVVGGLGPILGDQGSGTWMGMCALQAAMKYSNGWGEETLILDELRKAWCLEKDTDAVTTVHHHVAPFRKAATVTKMIGAAAQKGDKVALQILQDAGEQMALQTLCLIDKYQIPIEKRYVVCAGGAWKTHPKMYDTFKKYLLQKCPQMHVHYPWFEPVMSGPAWVLTHQGMDRKIAKQLLEKEFSQYIMKR